MNDNYKQLNAHYRRWLDTLGYSAGLVYDYTHRVRDFLLWLDTEAVSRTQGVSRIDQLTQRHVSRYFAYLESRPNRRRKGALLGTSFLNHNFAAVDKFLEFLHQHGQTNAPAPTGKRMPHDEGERIRKIQTLTQTEVKTMTAAIENTFAHLGYKQRELKHYQLRLIFALYYGCGLRLTEGTNLVLGNIDFERRTVFVEKGKNYKDRFVPMSGGVYNTLQDYIYNFRNQQKAAHKRLFLQGDGMLSESLKHLQVICADEQIQAKRLSMHVLRHSIATHLLQNGMSIENIALFLGHSSLESTQIYTHIIEK